jgi:hypothetical protein
MFIETLFVITKKGETNPNILPWVSGSKNHDTYHIHHGILLSHERKNETVK